MTGHRGRPLKVKIRADLFTQLAALEEAGLPFDKVLEIVLIHSGAFMPSLPPELR